MIWVPRGWRTWPPSAFLNEEARARALREAFRNVRREVWRDRESRLRATWESYG